MKGRALGYRDYKRLTADMPGLREEVNRWRLDLEGMLRSSVWFADVTVRDWYHFNIPVVAIFGEGDERAGFCFDAREPGHEAWGWLWLGRDNPIPAGARRLIVEHGCELDSKALPPPHDVPGAEPGSCGHLVSRSVTPAP